MTDWKSKLLAKKDEPKDVSRPWRVSFIDAAALPDIKVVRTKFLLNYGCVALAVGAFIFALMQELSIRETSAEIVANTGRIDSMSAADLKIRTNAALCDEYLVNAAAFTSFKRPKFDIFGVYSALGALRADGFVFENLLLDRSAVDFKTKKPICKIVLSGKRKGKSGEDIRQIEQLYGRIVELDYFKSLKAVKLAPRAPGSLVTTIDQQDQFIGFVFEFSLEEI